MPAEGGTPGGKGVNGGVGGARRNSIPIDLLSFSYTVLPTEPTEAAPEGVYVEGMFLEGARLDTTTMRLEECESKVRRRGPLGIPRACFTL